MRLLCFAIAFTFLCAATARAGDLITARITVTNAPAGNTNTITWNGVTHTFTNDITLAPNTLIQETNTAPWSATNILNQFTLYPSDFGSYLSVTNDTNVLIRGTDGGAVTITIAGGWGGVTYSTQTVGSPNIAVRVPISYATASQRTNIASGLVEALQYASNAVFAHWTAMAQFPALTNNNTFTGTNSLSDGGWNRASITNAALVSGILGNTTNGFNTNGVFHSPKLTNGVNYGAAFRSPGDYPFSEQFGTSADVSGGNAVAIGYTAIAATNAISMGFFASAGVFSVALGSSADSSAGTNSIALGQSANIGFTSNAIAIGKSAQVNSYHHNSVALGTSVQTTTNNQIMLGTSSYRTTIPGRLEPTGTTTNETHTGTARLGVSGGPYALLALSRYNNSSLAAGNNTMDIGGASYVKGSGAGAAFTLNGLTNSPAGMSDGLWFTFQNSESHTLTIANDSGSAPAGTRIYTGTGGDLTLTNNPKFAVFLYDSGTAHWGVVNHSN